MIATAHEIGRPPPRTAGAPPVWLAPPHDDVARLVRVSALPDPQALAAWKTLVLSAGEDERLVATVDILLSLRSVDPPLEHNHGYPVILLEGPPGVGKTMRATTLPSAWAALRGQRGHLLHVRAASLGGSGLSESPGKVAALFDLIGQQAASGLFTCVAVDECEDIFRDRDQIDIRTNPQDAEKAVTAALVGLDNLLGYPNVLWIWTTNHADKLDASVRDRVLFREVVPVLSKETRRQMLQAACDELFRRSLCPHLDPMSFEVAWTELAPLTKQMSGRGIAGLPIRAMVMAGGATHVRMDHVIATARETIRTQVVDAQGDPL